MKKGLKKVLVLVMAVVMLAGSVLTAMAADETTTEETKINVHFSLDKTKGKFVGSEEETLSLSGADKVNIPTVEANDDYEFVGWVGYGKEEIRLDAGALTLAGLKDLAWDGNISLTAQFNKIEAENPEVPDEKPEAAEVNVHFSVDKAYVQFVEDATKDSVTKKDADKVTIPEVKAVEGYKFTGWKGYGNEEIVLDADAFELAGLSTLAKDGNIALVAQYEKIAVEEKVNVHFSVDKAYVQFVKDATKDSVTETGVDKVKIPEVKAVEGYKFTGWKGYGKEEIVLDADAFELAGLKTLAKDGNIALVAQYEKVATEEAKTVEVYFNVDATKGYFTDPAGAEIVTFKGIAADSDQQFLVPKVAAKEGYVFTGWKGQGAGEIAWDANTTTFGVTGLAHFPEGSNVGYATIEAVFEEAPAEVYPASADVVIDLEKGSFEGYEGVDKLENENLQECDYTLGFLPVVKANEGYVFTGWKVTTEDGSDIYTLDAAATSIAFPYGVGDHYIVRATFEEVAPDTPVDPGKPDPEKPDSEKPDSEKPAKPAQKPAGTVQTGDATSTVGLVVLMLAAVAVVSGIVLKKKSTNR